MNNGACKYVTEEPLKIKRELKIRVASGLCVK